MWLILIILVELGTCLEVAYGVGGNNKFIPINLTKKIKSKKD